MQQPFLQHIMSPMEDDEIRLRAVELEDVDILYQIENSAGDWLDSDSTAPYSREQLTQYAATYDADPFRAGQVRLVVENKQTITACGFVDLYEISPKNLHALAGIYILPEFRRRQLALRSLLLIEDYAKNILGIKSIAARIAETNEASISLFTRAGYRQAGFLENWIHRGTLFIGMSIYQKQLY